MKLPLGITSKKPAARGRRRDAVSDSPLAGTRAGSGSRSRSPRRQRLLQGNTETMPGTRGGDLELGLLGDPEPAGALSGTVGLSEAALSQSV